MVQNVEFMYSIDSMYSMYSMDSMESMDSHGIHGLHSNGDGNVHLNCAGFEMWFKTLNRKRKTQKRTIQTDIKVLTLVLTCFD